MIYLLQVSTCWVLFYMIYTLFLRKETFFSINRYYLLGALLLGLAIPYIGGFIPANSASTEVYTMMYEVTVSPQMATAETFTFTWVHLFWAVYIVGALIVALRLMYGLYNILTIYRSGVVEVQENYTLVRSQKPHLPFSFFSWVFISEKMKLGDEMERIIKHEELHVSQWHSIDILLTEMLQVFFWFNPVLVFYKRALRQSHEYLADAYVTDDSEKYSYGQLLLGQSTSGLEIALANQFFNSQIKKRIKMMYKERSSKPAMVKYLAALPVLVVLLLIFSSHVNFSNSNFDKEKVSHDIKTYFSSNPLDTESIMDFVGSLNTKYPNQRTELSEVFDELSPIKGYTIDLSKGDEEKKLCINWNSGADMSSDDNSWSSKTENLKSEKVFQASLSSESQSTTSISQNRNVTSVYLANDGSTMINSTKLGARSLRDVLKSIPPSSQDGELILLMSPEPKVKSSRIEEVIAIGTELGYTVKLDHYPEWKDVSAEPLVVVDGVVKGKGQSIITNINSDDIESMVVLKGDAALKKYGERGKDGVIEITLKDKHDFVFGDTDEIFKVVEEMPRFAGCEDIAGLKEKDECAKQKMLEYIYKNITYPAKARDKGIEGMVVLQFIVKKDGSIEDAKVVRKIGGGCDEESLRVVNSFPTWIPGKQQGKKVNVLYTLPIRYKLSDEDKVQDEKPCPTKLHKGYPVITQNEVDKPALFPGTTSQEESQQALLTKVYTSIIYPAEARDNDIEGVNVLRFVISADGYIVDHELTRTIGWGTEEVCKDLMETLADMEPWTPAVKDDKNVASEFTLPIKFKLEGAKKDNSLKINGPIAFPNPSDGVFNIRFDPKSKAQATVRVYDLNGRILRIYDGLIGNVDQQVDLREYGVNTAFINVIQDEEVYTEKIIIK